MKNSKCFLIFFVAFLLVCGLFFFNETPRYGGEDNSGNTADSIIRSYYENYKKEDFSSISIPKLKAPFDKNMKLISLEECFIDEDFIPYKSDQWHKNSYAYCVVNTKAYFYCLNDCMYGDKGTTVLNTFSYQLIMEAENSEWKIVDFGY